MKNKRYVAYMADGSIWEGFSKNKFEARRKVKRLIKDCYQNENMCSNIKYVKQEDK